MNPISFQNYMEKLNYPFVCYPLSDSAWLGMIVGSEYQVVDKDIKSLKNTLTDYLHKQYKKHDEYPYTTILEPKIKMMEVRVRPTYQEEGGRFPSPEMIKVPVTAIYGENDSGYYECYFPMLNESFYYYDPKQFSPLATHFAKTVLNRLTPGQINRLFLYKEPVLETISLKVNYDRDFNWGNNAYQRSLENLSKLAEKFPHSKAEKKRISLFPEAAWELEDTVKDVADKILTERSNILIVGDSGTGKSAVLKQAFKKLTTHLKKSGGNMTFWRIMPQRITAGSKYLGEWEQKCEQLIQELQHAAGLLWVEDISRLMMIGGSGPEDSVAAFFSAFLRDGDLHMVGEVTPSQLDSMRRMLPGFVENFRIINLKELPEAKIFGILDKFSEFATRNLKINIQRAAMEVAYRLLLRYHPYEKFPGKAVRFLSTCVSTARVLEKDTIGKNDVIEEFSRKTGLPEMFLRDDLKLDTEELETWFKSKVIGQPIAVRKMMDVVKIYKTGLNNPYKPISTMLFAGPTGVGKTASAKALADYFFGKGQTKAPLIRLDMSEFRHPGQILRLIGDGREVGKLVKEVRERPFSVLLLDEVEKADPSIFDALLTVLDEGRLVDAYGRITHFRNTIIIMTSNLGASNQKALGFGSREDESVRYESAIGKFFRPEFVNRIDGIVMFRSLDAKDVRKITLKELKDLQEREGFTKRGLKPEFTDRMIDHLQETGFDEKYGARPLQRAIENEITAPLAEWLLLHKNLKNATILIDYDNGLKISKK